AEPFRHDSNRVLDGGPSHLDNLLSRLGLREKVRDRTDQSTNGGRHHTRNGEHARERRAERTDSRHNRWGRKRRSNTAADCEDQLPVVGNPRTQGLQRLFVESDRNVTQPVEETLYLRRACPLLELSHHGVNRRTGLSRKVIEQLR